MIGNATARGRANVWVCVTCQRAPGGVGGVAHASDGRALYNAVSLVLESHPDAELVALHAVECMSSCGRACAVAFGVEKKCTYLFGDLDPEGVGAEAIVSCAVIYALQPGPRLRRVDIPEPLRLGLIARVPPLPW